MQTFIKTKAAKTVEDLTSLEFPPDINVSRMSPKLLRTLPHIVENLGITMAPLFLRLTS